MVTVFMPNIGLHPHSFVDGVVSRMTLKMEDLWTQHDFTKFTPIFRACVFLGALYMGGTLCRLTRLCSIIGDIVVGICLGPQMFNLLQEKPGQPHFFRELGLIGVTLMLFESGLQVQFHKWQQIWGRSLLVALLGTCLPIGTGIVFAYVLGWKPYPDGAALGCALAPTSAGMAIQALTEAKQRGSVYGQTIISAAFLDDVFSIMTWIVLWNTSTTQSTFQACIVPTLYVMAFLIFAGAAAFRIFPEFLRVMTTSLERIDSHLITSEKCHLTVMILILIMYSWLTNFIGSHLLGAFMAGVSFCMVPRSLRVWTRQTRDFMAFLIRCYFGCTVAFAIPAWEMVTLAALWKGVLCALGPCILTKTVSGVFLGPQRWLVGSAMVMRRDLAYYIAYMSVTTQMIGKDYNLMSDDMCAVCCYALLIASLSAPFACRFFLARELKTRQKTGVHGFSLKIVGRYYSGMVHEVLDVLEQMNLEANDANIETDGVVCELTLTCTTKSPDDSLDNEKFTAIGRMLFEALADDDGQIAITRFGDQNMINLMPQVLLDPESSQRHYVVVKMMSDHDPTFLQEIYGILVAQVHCLCIA